MPTASNEKTASNIKKSDPPSKDQNSDGIQLLHKCYCYKYPDGGFTGLDLGPGGKEITKIRFLPVLQTMHAMIGGKFQGSNDTPDSGYEDLHVISRIPRLGWNTVIFGKLKKYRYLRYIGAPGSHSMVGTIEYYSAGPCDETASNPTEIKLKGIPFGAGPPAKPGVEFDAVYKEGPDVLLTYKRHAAETGCPLSFITVKSNEVFLHQHDFVEIIYIKHGSCFHQLEDRISFLVAGDLCIIPPGVDHTYFGGVNLSIFNTMFYQDDIPSEIRVDLARLPGFTRVFSGQPNFYAGDGMPEKLHLHLDQQREIQSLMDKLEVNPTEKPDGYRISTYAWFILFIVQLSKYFKSYNNMPLEQKKSPRSFELAAKAVSFIEQNYSVIMDVKEIIEPLQISYSRLAHLFKEEIGISVYDYLVRYRVSQACQQLINSKEKLTEIAYKIGFHNYSNFALIFKQLIGYSPLEFRQEYGA
ncbi:MAG: AraC family transcriptional regulator [Bacillota bacterium]